MKYKLSIIALTALFGAGCIPSAYNSNMPPREAYFLDLKKQNTQSDDYNQRNLEEDVGNKSIKRKKTVEDMTYNSKDSTSATAYQNRYKKGKKEQYKIVAEDMEIHKFLYYIFQESLKSDFYIDPKIQSMKEKVTLKLDKQLTKGAFINLLKDLLKPYKIKIEEKDGVYRALYTNKFPREVKGGTLITSSEINSNVSNDTVVSQYIECKYIDVNDFVNLAAGIFYKDVSIKTLKNQNGLIINGTYEQIKQVINFKNVIDRPFMTQKQTSLVYFNYITPSDFKKEFEKIMSYQNLGDEKMGNFKILPLDNINALMVITSNRDNLKFLLKWKKKLDSYQKSNDIQETYFYTSKYRSIEEIYKLVSQFGNQNIPNKKKKTKEQNDIQSDNKKEFVKTETRDNNSTKSSMISTQFDKNAIKIVPDPERNVLIIQATQAQYKKLLGILQKIDTQPLQILVEANIIEVTLQDDLQYGMEWFLRNTTEANPNTGRGINILGKTTMGVGSGGFFGIISSDYFNTILNLFAKKELINVLSHPKILVLNGETASMQVGESIPVLSSTLSNVSNPENAVSTVSYSDTGITLNVQPSVTSKGVVTMKISQSISTGQKNGLSSISSPIILNRQIDTKVVLRDNQSVVMGGLIKQDLSTTNTKVPFFGDIPLINGLFRSTSKNVTKTELVLIIKVHIIDNFDILDEIKEQFNQLLSSASINQDRFYSQRNTMYEEPDILISSDNLDKYYDGEMDKYNNINEEVVKTIQKVKVQKTSKPIINNKKDTKDSGWVFADDTQEDMPIQSYTAKKGWIFADDTKKSVADKPQTEVFDGKTYRLDSDGDYVLVE